MNANHVVVSAPGKVILFGEHAVVYGKPAIAASIGLRTTVAIEQSNKQCVSLCLQNLNKTFEWSLDDLQRIFPEIIFRDRGSHYMPLPPQLSCLDAITQLIGQDDQDLESLRDAAKVFLYYISSFMHVNKRFIPIDVCVSSNLPIGAGLGSSASYSISLVTGMLLAVGSISCSSQKQENSETFQEHSVAKDLAGHPLENKRDIQKPCKDYTLSPQTLKLICKWAFEAEKLIHGTPSGIDNSISTFGGALQFLNGEITHLESFPALQILLVDTKIPRSTGRLVSGLKEKYKEFPLIYGPLFDGIGDITNEGLKILKTLYQQQNMQNQSLYRKNNLNELEKLIDRNHQLLADMGVSHQRLDQLCQITTKFNLHSKLTGAGGGGCAITLINEGTSEDDVSKLCKILTEQNGFQVWRTRLGSDGLLVHKCEY